jgi:hypothetical protein
MRKLAAMMMTLALLVMLVACGGSSSNNGGTPPPVTQVKLNMTAASSLINQGTQFTANVPVNWAVTEKNGGSITNNGLYTSPTNIGVFHVTATAVADTTKSASAVVNVSAAFLSMQTLPGGTAKPYSVTPMLTTFKSDGTWTTDGVIDPATGQPFDVAVYDLVLSPDGARAAFTILTPMTDDVGFAYNIGIAEAKTTTITLLTHNETVATYGADMFPQFSPDSKTLIFGDYRHDSSAGTEGYAIKTMNIDGSNVQTILYSTTEGYWFPTYAPDGKTIVFERASGNDYATYQDGIATMNADGSNIIQLTGKDAVSNPCWGWDAMPTYTSDGKSIVFTRECFPADGGVSDTLYSLSANGITTIQGSGYAGIMACQPRALEKDVILFSSNESAPGTNNFEIWFMSESGNATLQLTNNSVYDGFSAYWMNYNTTTAAARAFQRNSPLQQRLTHMQMSRQHKVVVKK